jgi:glycosyltransferase involved in cell wall biosynthesis
MKKNRVCVVIPCYKVRDKILSVLKKINFKIIDKVVLVDDFCPEYSGRFAKKNFQSNKISYIFLKKNKGVGGATIAGFQYAKKKNFNLVIKLDGDGQHNPKILKKFIKILSSEKYDFCKGYRNLDIFVKDDMPIIRKIGNISLTFISRIVTGYYNLMDVTNGMIGLRVSKFSSINFALIKKDFFFEQDLIFHLSVKKFKFYHIKTPTIYEDEKSNLRPFRSIFPFAIFHLKNLIYRILS